VIETTATLEIRARAVPLGGSLSVGASPLSSGGTAPASSCGAPAPGACLPGRARESAIVVHAAPSEVLPVPDCAAITLSTDLGWLQPTSCQAGGPRATTLYLAAKETVAQAFACFPDLGGTATVTARSGSVTSNARIEVRPIPQAVALVPSRLQATAGAAVTFVAFVSDCDGQGVANVSLAFQVTSGALELDAGTPAVVKTGADGFAAISGTARGVPLALTVGLLGAAQVSCQATIGATP